MKKNKLSHIRRRSQLKNFETHVPNLVSSVSIITNQLQIPPFLKQNLLHENRIIKRFLNDPQAHLKIFYYQLLKICFQVESHQSISCIQKIYELIDEDQFQFNIPKNQENPCYLQLNTRKIKRVMNQFFEHIQDENISIDLALCKFPIMDKIFTIFMRTLLIMSEKVVQFDEYCDIQNIYGFLASYFEIEMNQYEKCLKFDLMDTFVYQVSPLEIYLIYIQKSESQRTSQNCSFASQSQEQCLKFYLDSSNSQSSEIKITQMISQINIKPQSFDNSIDSVYQDHQIIRKSQQLKNILKTQPNERKYSNFRLQQNKSCLYMNKDTMTSTADQFLSPLRQKPKTLSEMTSRKQSIQLSIYQQSQTENQYSELESLNTISTLRKLGELTKRKFQGCKINIQKQKTLTCESQQNQQNKLTFRKGSQIYHRRSRNISKIQIEQNKVQNTKNDVSQRQSKNKGLIRIQDLYKRLDTYVSVQTETKKSINFSKKSQKFVGQELTNQISMENKKTLKENSGPSKFLKIKPKSFLKKATVNIDLTKNVYSKFGYIDMNISNQFTSSFILKQMQPQFYTNIKQIKQNARVQRQTAKLLNQQMQTQTKSRK